VNVYKNATITTGAGLQQHTLNQSNWVATSSGTSSPFTLIAMSGSSGFTGSGTYMVSVNRNDPNTIPMTVSKFKTDVSFTNGSATVDWNTMTDVATLP
jgi:hypothetical protein